MEVQLKEDLLKFILAGDATFTLESTESLNRYTYRVRPNIRNGKIVYYYVHLLTGSNNEKDYEYIGSIPPSGNSFSGIGESLAKQAFRWFYIRLIQGKDVSRVNFYHAGKCARCGRKLTTPESIKSGFGSKCINLI